MSCEVVSRVVALGRKTGAPRLRVTVRGRGRRGGRDEGPKTNMDRNNQSDTQGSPVPSDRVRLTVLSKKLWYLTSFTHPNTDLYLRPEAKGRNDFDRSAGGPQTRVLPHVFLSLTFSLFPDHSPEDDLPCCHPCLTPGTVSLRVARYITGSPESGVEDTVLGTGRVSVVGPCVLVCGYPRWVRVRTVCAVGCRRGFGPQVEVGWTREWCLGSETRYTREKKTRVGARTTTGQGVSSVDFPSPFSPGVGFRSSPPLSLRPRRSIRPLRSVVSVTASRSNYNSPITGPSEGWVVSGFSCPHRRRHWSSFRPRRTPVIVSSTTGRWWSWPGGRGSGRRTPLVRGPEVTVGPFPDRGSLLAPGRVSVP